MLDSFFSRKDEQHFPRVLYELTCDLFALVQFWKPEVNGIKRGRLFETILEHYCERSGLPLKEKSGSRSLRGVRAASGYFHENDAVIGFPDFTLHCELKHLTTEVPKSDVLIFNQKGMDHLLADDRTVRRLPLYRIILSGGVVSASARRFAVQWGILIIEPDRLPLTLIHFLAGRMIPNLRSVPDEIQEEIWSEVPRLIVPLQHRLRRVAQLLDNDEECCVGEYRLKWVLESLQRVIGDYYWNAMDEATPQWLEHRFEEVAIGCGGDLVETCEGASRGNEPPLPFCVESRTKDGRIIGALKRREADWWAKGMERPR
jgi:hypothetical protein